MVKILNKIKDYSDLIVGRIINPLRTIYLSSQAYQKPHVHDKKNKFFAWIHQLSVCQKPLALIQINSLNRNGKKTYSCSTSFLPFNNKFRLIDFIAFFDLFIFE